MAGFVQIEHRRGIGEAPRGSRRISCRMRPCSRQVCVYERETKWASAWDAKALRVRWEQFLADEAHHNSDYSHYPNGGMEWMNVGKSTLQSSSHQTQSYIMTKHSRHVAAHKPSMTHSSSNLVPKYWSTSATLSVYHLAPVWDHGYALRLITLCAAGTRALSLKSG
jgi:hypothetical protein